jgi:hypothetical protein
LVTCGHGKRERDIAVYVEKVGFGDTGYMDEKDDIGTLPDE